MFCEGKKSSKLKAFLIWYSLLYGLIKVLQFLNYVHSISTVIYDEDCDEPCVVEYLELTFIACVFVPLSIFLYGVVKVNLSGWM